MKIIRGIVSVILGLIILIGAGCVIMYAIGIRPFVVISGSMEPTIETGSVCFIDTRVGFNEIRENDIIAFAKGDGTLVTHRVVNYTSQGLETKGDANNIVDEDKVTVDNYYGKNVYFIPKLGYTVKSIQTDKGKVVIGVFFVILLLSSIFLNDSKNS